MLKQAVDRYFDEYSPVHFWWLITDGFHTMRCTVSHGHLKPAHIQSLLEYSVQFAVLLTTA